MIFIYGDSHGNDLFLNLKLPHLNFHKGGITMHRIGRDKKIINFDNTIHDKKSVICLVYGEIDCRAHIKIQVNMGHNMDDVIKGLVNNYFRAILLNIKQCKRIVVVGIVPPTKKSDYEEHNGKLQGEFPFVGKDHERVQITKKMNTLIEEYCNQYNMIYFNPHDFYTREDGTLKYEMSDKTVHIRENQHFLEKFTELYKNIMKNNI